MTLLHHPRNPYATRHPHHAVAYIRATSTDLTDLRDDGTVLDLAAIERALNGIPVDLTPAEQYEAGRQLNARGQPPLVIAERTGLNPRRIARLKAAGWPEAPSDSRRGLRRGTPSLCAEPAHNSKD